MDEPVCRWAFRLRDRKRAGACAAACSRVLITFALHRRDGRVVTRHECIASTGRVHCSWVHVLEMPAVWLFLSVLNHVPECSTAHTVVLLHSS